MTLVSNPQTEKQIKICSTLNTLKSSLKILISSYRFSNQKVCDFAENYKKKVTQGEKKKTWYIEQEMFQNTGVGSK